MSSTIRIPGDLYKRLESHAKGFDSPVSVIERLLDHYESKPVESNIPQTVKLKKPELLFHPSEDEFKANLLECGKAFIALHKSNGAVEIVEWKAEKFSTSSSLRGNLWSGQLRNWESNNIVKAEVSINTNDFM
jgi:predicted CopG family antitoxin